MRLLLLLSLLAAVSGQGRREYGEYSEVDNVFFKGELAKFTEEFHSELGEKVTELKEEMLQEFLETVQRVESVRHLLSEELSTQLETQIAGILSKFGKVMKYSASQIEKIYGDIDSVLARVASTSHDSLDPLANHNNFDMYTDRRRRGAKDEGDKELSKPLEEIIDPKTLSNFDSLEIPAKEEQILSEIVAFSDYFDGHIESQESDFVLWSQASQRKQQQYKVLVQRPETKKIPPAEEAPRDCYDLLARGNTQDGVYRIFPQGTGEGVQVFCDQTTGGGGWTHVLRRYPSRIEQKLNFTRSTEDYVQGFGTPFEEHWLGLSNLFHLTSTYASTLQVSLIDSQLQPSAATYYTFSVGGPTDAFRLTVTDYDESSSAVDALSPHSLAPFAFPDSPTGISAELVVNI